MYTKILINGEVYEKTNKQKTQQHYLKKEIAKEQVIDNRCIAYSMSGKMYVLQEKTKKSKLNSVMQELQKELEIVNKWANIADNQENCKLCQKYPVEVSRVIEQRMECSECGKEVNQLIEYNNRLVCEHCCNIPENVIRMITAELMKAGKDGAVVVTYTDLLLNSDKVKSITWWEGRNWRFRGMEALKIDDDKLQITWK